MRCSNCSGLLNVITYNPISDGLYPLELKTIEAVKILAIGLVGMFVNWTKLPDVSTTPFCVTATDVEIVQKL